MLGGRCEQIVSAERSLRERARRAVAAASRTVREEQGVRLRREGSAVSP
jgi:hypothetical protein